MAEGGITLFQEHLSCSICLDLLKGPVTIPCGHSYCSGCINGYWNRDDHAGVFSCPQCRQTFTPRPVLGRNNMLVEVLEKLMETGLEAAPPTYCFAGLGDESCDICPGRKLKAVKSCLMCLASFCEIHVQPHYESPPLKKHKLLDATGNLQENICPYHDKALEIYCRTDQKFICVLCTVGDHKHHDSVSAAAQRTEKQAQLTLTKGKFQQRIQDREKELQDLRQALQLLQHSAQAAVEDSDRIFGEIILSIKRRCCAVKKLIRDQERAEVTRAEGLLERLEQEIAELKRREAELEQLLQTEDHIHFLQNYQPHCTPPGPGNTLNITFDPHFAFQNPVRSVSELKEHLEDLCKGGLLKITESVNEVGILQIPQPTTREDFLQYYCQLTLDPNTANSKLSLFEGNREATRVENMQSYPDHPARFDYWEQVLCREGLSGRHYWEVEWSGKGNVCIAVSYIGIARKGWGYDGLLGYNNKSWSLWSSPSKCYFYRNQKCKRLPSPLSSRIGVYLDHRAGTLSFFSITDTMTLLHKVCTSFTQPLYPGFYADTAGSAITLCPIGEEAPILDVSH